MEGEENVISSDQRPTCEMLASMAESIKSLTENVAVLNEKFGVVVRKNVEQEATISLLHEKNLSLCQQVDELSMIVARRSQQLATTPEGGMTNANKRQRISTDVSSFNLVLLKHLTAEVLPHRPQHFPILQQHR